MGGHVGGDPRSGAEGVTIISLGAMNLAETEMPRLWERLESFPNLQHLDLSVTRITAAELRQIRRLPLPTPRRGSSIQYPPSSIRHPATHIRHLAPLPCPCDITVLANN